MSLSLDTAAPTEEIYYQLAAQETDAKQAAKTRRKSHQSKARQLNQSHIEELKDQQGKIRNAGIIGLIGGLIGSLGQVVTSFAPGLGAIITQGVEKALSSIQQFLQQAAADDGIEAETLQAKAGTESDQAADAGQDVEDANQQRQRLQNELEKILELNQQAQDASVRV